MKKCTKCKCSKELKNFNKNSKSLDGVGSWCKSCIKENNKKQWKENKLSGRSKHHALKTTYGLELKEVEQMYIDQGGKCAICDKFKATFTQSGGLYIDHDHVTGQIRGLLCNSCNVMLGLAKDNIEVLVSAINYLKIRKVDPFEPTNHN